MRELRREGQARCEGGKQRKLTTKANIRGPESGDRVYCIILGSAASPITEDFVRPFDIDAPPP
jgi:hypothetical protein